jgi:alkanesulfonate monooxygenase SsuD/methylene tetrahydromethanopterin reductase-like flavin-dependent oxidoreductase (luciferase family)
LQLEKGSVSFLRKRKRPFLPFGVNIIAAETDAEAQYLFTSLQMRFADMARGSRGYMKPPIADIARLKSYEVWRGYEVGNSVLAFYI